MEHVGVTDTLGNVSIPVSAGSDRGLVLTSESQTQGTVTKNNRHLPVTLYFN